MKILHAFVMCLSMFCALPVPCKTWDEDARGLMTACLPGVGMVIGALWLALGALGRRLLPPMLAAAWIAALPFLVTGFMHLDGFMDTVDAILSWRSPEERQKILKDVHCGSFAVVGIVLLMMGMFAAAAELSGRSLRPLLLLPVASRCLSAFCVTFFRPIGHSEYASLNRNLGTPAAALVMLALTLLAGALWLGRSAVGPLLAVVAGYSAAMLCAMRSLRGVSGDLAGYALCVGELCGLAAMSIF